MEFIDYINWKLSFLFFVMLLVATLLYAGEKNQEKKSIGFLIFTALMFISTILILPTYTLNKAIENKTHFEKGDLLKCISGVGIGASNMYIVNKDEWTQRGNYLINNQNKLTIEIINCEKF